MKHNLCILVEGDADRATPPYERLAAELAAAIDTPVPLLRGALSNTPKSGWVLADLATPWDVQIPDDLRARLLPLNLYTNFFGLLARFDLPGAVGEGVVNKWDCGYMYKMGHGFIGRRQWLDNAGMKSFPIRDHEEDYAHWLLYKPLAQVIVTYLELAERVGPPV